TKRLLAAVGVPVPEGVLAASAAEAWEVAQDIGLPVVVKPADGNHGRGVTLELTTQAQVELAWERADHHGSEVIVERYVPGHEHRLLVVAGRLVAAARGEAAWVTGDGTHDVAALVAAQLNSDPRRGRTEDHPLAWLDVQGDGSIRADLARQGLAPDSVPEAGRRVLIQRNGNVAIDCTDDVHPDFARLASLAARTVGLDIAGIDLVAEDIAKPAAGQRAAVVEVNAGPGLLAHLKPAVGAPRPVGRAIVDHLFPAGEDGRITVIGLCGGGDNTASAQLLAWLLRLAGRQVGLACRDGVSLDGRVFDRGDGTDVPRAQQLLMNRSIDSAVFDQGAAAILDQGLPYDRCRVGVVTDLDGAERLAHHDVHDADQLLKVVRAQIDAVLPAGTGVLNADDPRLAQLAGLCDGEVMLYATDEAVLATHRAGGGRAVLGRDGRVWLCEGMAEMPLRLHRTLPAALLPAVAAAWACGLAPALLAAGLDTDPAHEPAETA
ncbi:MAG: ATP-grasp domain-containing protein, partial [Rubrivivax sp.]|nr:ATP-grasp domain-containing protein [Rubrivivax sp.]